MFDSNPIVGSPELTLQADEVEAAHWLDPDDAVALRGERGQARMRAAIHAHAGGPVAFIDSRLTSGPTTAYQARELLLSSDRDPAV